MTEYTKSIVSYFDILGFKRIVAEAKEPSEIERKLKALSRFSSPSEGIIETFGNTFTNFSDLVLRTVPVLPNPQLRGDEGVLYWELMDLVHAQAELIGEGVLLRGGVTFGDIFVDGETAFGPALIRAYELESEVAGAPRVIVDPEIFGHLDTCRALRCHDTETEMQYLLRVLRKDTDGVWFVDYLRAFESEADDELTYLRFLKEHRQVIVNHLSQAKRLDSVLTKYGWLVNYHNNWVDSLNEEVLQGLGASKEKLVIHDNLTALLPSFAEDPQFGGI
jgi:hypothetical protein